MVLFIPAALLAQEFRGTLTGAVTDNTGARIPAAKVVATETHTGSKSETVSDSAGRYTIPFLQPGDYNIVVQVAGFKESVRKDIHVGSGDHIGIDVILEVGDTTISVTVSSDAPLLNSENSSVGQAITTKEVEICWRWFTWATTECICQYSQPS